MFQDHHRIEDGFLIPVLRQATHEELASIINSLDRGSDVFIKRSPLYLAAQHDLTKVPKFIARSLCRAGGHSLWNLFRGGDGPSYRVVLEDVCSKFSVPRPTNASAVALEEALLEAVIKRVLADLPAEQRDELLSRLAGKVGRPIPWNDVLGSAAPFSALGMSMLPLVLEQLGLLGTRSALLPILGAAAWPLAIATIVLGIASNVAGPTYKATIPAVIQVAILRQRLLWERSA